MTHIPNAARAICALSASALKRVEVLPGNRLAHSTEISTRSSAKFQRNLRKRCHDAIAVASRATAMVCARRCAHATSCGSKCPRMHVDTAVRVSHTAGRLHLTGGHRQAHGVPWHVAHVYFNVVFFCCRMLTTPSSGLFLIAPPSHTHVRR